MNKTLVYDGETWTQLTKEEWVAIADRFPISRNTNGTNYPVSFTILRINESTNTQYSVRHLDENIRQASGIAIEPRIPPAVMYHPVDGRDNLLARNAHSCAIKLSDYNFLIKKKPKYFYSTDLCPGKKFKKEDGYFVCVNESCFFDGKEFKSQFKKTSYETSSIRFFSERTGKRSISAKWKVSKASGYITRVQDARNRKLVSGSVKV